VHGKFDAFQSAISNSQGDLSDNLSLGSGESFDLQHVSQVAIGTEGAVVLT
jgi:hypothetical protein